MSRRVPLRASGSALLAIVTAAANSFSAPLQRCQIGTRGLLHKTASELLGCLPAVVVTIGDVDFQNNEQIQQYLEQGIPWDLTLLVPIPEDGEADLSFLADQEILAELFSGVDGNESLVLTGVTNCEVESVTLVSLAQTTELNNELAEPLPIASARARVLIKLNSWT